ncbi:MAG: L-threonylcarbamoyladenylate synthase [Coriobacteriales bacterium]
MGRCFALGRDGCDGEVTRLARAVLSSGGVAVIPTETVYGLALDPFACPGPDALFLIKRRSRELAIPWLVSGASALDVFARDVPGYARTLVRAFWPGALTVVVKASGAVPAPYRAADATIALRAPDEPFVQSLFADAASALCTTSANTHGAPPPCSTDELEPRIARLASLVVDGGPTLFREPSTIVSCTGPVPVVVREAALSAADVFGVVHHGDSSR